MGRAQLESGFEAAPQIRRLAEAVGVFCLFAILVCACTWPLVTGLPRYLPPHWDPRLNAWNMASNTGRLLTNPLLLFQGSNFYPYGTTKAFSEILLVPSLFSMPAFLTSENPVLSYNITLLVLWSLSGLAMYFCAREFIRHRYGALLAAAIWTISPYRTDYYLEFQMQMCFAVPLIVLYWYQFMRTQKVKKAALAFAFLVIQALSCWSYAIMVSFYILVFSLACVLLKWRGWSIRKLLKVIPVVIISSLVMFPFTRPYFHMRKELHVERRLMESLGHSADVLTYLETEPIRSYHFSLTRHHAETSLFPGFVALAFFALSFGYLFRRESDFPQSRAAPIAGLLAAAGLLFASIHLALRLCGVSGSLSFVHVIHFSMASVCVFCFSALLLGLRVWQHSKNMPPQRGFLDKDVLVAFLFACFPMFVMSLGPVVHLGLQSMDRGPYYRLYVVMFALRAVRIPVRFGAFALFSIAMLSGLGVKRLHSAFGERRRLIGALMGVPFLLAALEYFPGLLDYEELHWKKRPPVYDFVASDPADFAIAEWPLGWRYGDAECLLWSAVHGKKVLSGVSRWEGQIPHPVARSSLALSRLTRPEYTAASMAYLRATYPTKYLIVHRGSLREKIWRPWEKLMQNLPEGLTFLRDWNDRDYLFAISPIIERGMHFLREFSFEYLFKHSMARFSLWDASGAPNGRLVKIYFNGSEIHRDILTADWKQYKLKLPKPYRKVAPNCVRIVASDQDGKVGDIEFEGFSLSGS